MHQVNCLFHIDNQHFQGEEFDMYRVGRLRTYVPHYHRFVSMSKPDKSVRIVCILKIIIIVI